MGEVKDAKTDAGIPNVSVQIGATTVRTDGTGVYEVEGIPAGVYEFIASRDGYITATTTINVDEFSAAVSTIYLVPSAPAVAVGAEGGTITTEDTEGDVIRVSIPAGAVEREIEATVTPLQGLEIPGSPPEGYLSVATAHIGTEEPGEIEFEEPATITVPLPMKVSEGAVIPLFTFDTKTLKWQDTGTRATVNADGRTASAEVNQAGTFSVMPEVQTKEISRSSETITRERLPDDITDLVKTFKNSIEFKEDSGIDQSTLTHMVEQFKGVSFSKPTTISFSFISAEERNRLSEDDKARRWVYVEKREHTTTTMTISMGVAMAPSVAGAPSAQDGYTATSETSENSGSVEAESDEKHDQGQGD